MEGSFVDRAENVLALNAALRLARCNLPNADARLPLGCFCRWTTEVVDVVGGTLLKKRVCSTVSSVGPLRSSRDRETFRCVLGHEALPISEAKLSKLAIRKKICSGDEGQLEYRVLEPRTFIRLRGTTRPERMRFYTQRNSPRKPLRWMGVEEIFWRKGRLRSVHELPA